MLLPPRLFLWVEVDQPIDPGPHRCCHLKPVDRVAAAVVVIDAETVSYVAVEGAALGVVGLGVVAAVGEGLGAALMGSQRLPV